MCFAKSEIVIIDNVVCVEGKKGEQEVEDGGKRPAVAAAAAAGCYLKPSLMFTIP